MTDWALVGLLVNLGVVAWILVYSLTLLKRTRPLQRILGPIPDDLWDEATEVISEELRDMVEAKRRERANEEYRRATYGR